MLFLCCPCYCSLVAVITTLVALFIVIKIGVTMMVVITIFVVPFPLLRFQLIAFNTVRVCLLFAYSIIVVVVVAFPTYIYWKRYLLLACTKVMMIDYNVALFFIEGVFECLTGIRESIEYTLIHVHHKGFIGWRQFYLLSGKLFIEI